jgi:hypothetical protein
MHNVGHSAEDAKNASSGHDYIVFSTIHATGEQAMGKAA